MKLLEYIGYYNQFQSGALTKFKKRTIKSDQADLYIRDYCEWRLASQEMPGKKPDKPLIASLREGLKKLEDQYPSEKIIVLRKFGTKLVQQRLEQMRTEQEISKKVQEMSKEKIGWGLFMSRDRKAQEQKAIEEFKHKMESELRERLMKEKSIMDKEMQQLTEDLSRQQVMMNEEDYNKMPRGYLRFAFRISMPSLRFSFINEYRQSLFISEISGQQVSVMLGKGFTKALFQVEALSIEDCWAGATAYPNILETKELGTVPENAQAFIFKFESNEDMVISPFRIEISTQKTLFIVANIPFVKEISRSAMKALQGEELDFSFYRSAATEKALEYMNTGKEFIESIKKGDYKHKAIDISLYLKSPVIIVPESIFNPARPCLIIDTGSISLQSEVVPYTSGVDYKSILSPECLFDRYSLALQNFQVNILDEGLPEGVKGFQRGFGTPAIKEFNLMLTFFNCLEPMHPTYPTGEIDIVI